MPAASAFPTTSIKMLLVGKPGTGKTGGLISILLDDPEARLFVLNYDGANFGTLVNVATYDPATKARRPNADELLSRIQYYSFRDKIGQINGVPWVTGIPTAFQELGRKLNDWGDGFGGLMSWGPKDWLIIDSVSALCECALRYAAQQGGRLNKRLSFEDYGEAIGRLSLILEMINDEAVTANVCAITHIRYIGDLESGKDDKTGKPKELEALPNALGQKLPQEIGRYFNNIIQVGTLGEGPGTQRWIFTKPQGQLQLRNSNPGAVKDRYPLATGMAELVRDLRSLPSGAKPATPPPGAPAPTPATGNPAPAPTV